MIQPRRRRIILLTLSIVFFLLFYFFSREVRRGLTTRIDFDTTVRLQNKIPARFDQLWDDGAVLIDPVVSFFLVIALTALAFFQSDKKRFRLGVLVIPLAFFLLTAVEIYGKTTLPHPGPPFFMVKHPTALFPKFTIIEPYSYPSGHAARSTFLAVVTLFFFWSKLKNQTMRFLFIFLAASYTVFIYVGRVYLGQHWLSDILGGALLGGAFGILVATLCLKYDSPTG